MSGNKGAVGIRLEYHDTTFCFITAHLAAGHSNVSERNADYRTIANGLHFLKGKTINSHQSAQCIDPPSGDRMLTPFMIEM